MTSQTSPQPPAISAEAAQAIAQEAYIYGFPMVMNYKTLYNYAIDTQSPDYKGPFNQLACVARLFTPDDKAVVTPNADTPYCMFWMDLRAEPLVLSVPEMEPERFYHFQLIDLYTHNFAYVGTLTTGNGAGKYLLAGPNWQGEKPAGIDAVLQSETDFIFNVTRTQLFRPEDLERVIEIQTSYGLQSLSEFLGTAAPAAAPSIDFPEWVEGAQFDERFFGYFTFILSLLGSPLESEQPLWERFAQIGLTPHTDFDLAAQPPEIQAALKAGAKTGFAAMENFIKQVVSDPVSSAKIFGTREFLQQSAQNNYGQDTPYLLRAAAAHQGLYGNSGAEAIYPTYFVDADGQPLDASTRRYTLTFAKGTLPPVKAFWSLTMYDGRTQLFIDNPLNRYLLNSTMMDHFRWEADGSLVLHIAKACPDADYEPNWLPAPDGPFYMVMRLYGPELAALSGAWKPPQLQQVD
jgi:hypothetical protein